MVVLGLIYVLISRTSENSIAGETYKIGFIGALTGDGASYGEPLRNVAQIAVDEINAAGGINGKQLELIAEDGKCTGEAGVSAASKLVNIDKVQVIIGGVCSNESLAAIPVVEAAKVALVSPSSNTMNLSGKSPYFFRIYPTVTEEGKVLAEAVKDSGKKKVAFIQEQDDFTLGVFTAFKDEFMRLDSSATVINENFAPGTTDFRTILLNLKKENPDVLFINPLNPGTGDIIINQMKALNWKPQLILNDPIVGDSKTLLKNKEMFEGAWATEFTVYTDNPKMQHLIEVYKAKYGSDLAYQSFAQTTYDTVYLISEAIASVGYDGTKIATWGRMVKNWQGASGSVTIDAKGDRVGGPVIRVVKEGKLESVI